MATIQTFDRQLNRFVDVEIDMSKKTIEAYAAHRVSVGRPLPKPIDMRGTKPRTARTEPPPAPQTHADDLRAHAANLRHTAAQILSQATELDEAADRLEGK